MQALELKTPKEIMEVSRMLAKSGYFQDAKDEAQAFVKVLAGREIGFPSFASMTGIHIIKGKPTLGANLMAAAVKRSSKYNYQVNKLDNKVCELSFFENGQEIGISKFDLDEAKRAGTQNLAKYPKNMLFARAISNGIKWFCPDLFLGAPVYTPEELGAQVDEEGEVITIEDKPKQLQQTKTQQRAKQTNIDSKLSKEEAQRLHVKLSADFLLKDEKDRKQLASATTKREVSSFTELTREESKAVYANAQNIAGGFAELIDGEVKEVIPYSEVNAKNFNQEIKPEDALNAEALGLKKGTKRWQLNPIGDPRRKKEA